MDVYATAAQPKKTWVAIAVEGARPSAKAKMTPVPKAEPKGKAASVSEAKSASAPKAEVKETMQAEPKGQEGEGRRRRRSWRLSGVG